MDYVKLAGRLVALILLPVLMGSSAGHGPPLKSSCVTQGRIESFIVLLREPDEIASMYQRMAAVPHGNEGRTGLAFMAVDSKGEKMLVLPALRGQTDHERLEIWGHELAHIICGRYHG